MKLDSLLWERRPVAVQRPPELWSVDGDEEPFESLIRWLIDEGMRYAPAGELALGVSNVTVSMGNEPDGVGAGDFVAFGIRGSGSWGPDLIWTPGVDFGLDGFVELVASVGAVYAYR